MRTISIANQKGGCGKTTTAINLSSALASCGRKILVIDLDPQAHASFGLGVSSQLADKAIYNILTDNAEKRRTIDDCIVNVSQNLDIVPSNILLSTLEQELKDKEDAVSKLYQALSANHLNYDYAVVDSPPSLGFLTFNALRAADLVIVPIDMSAFSLMGVSKLLGMLELIKLKINHAPLVKALATLFDKRTKYSQTMLDDIKTFFKEDLLETVIRMSVALRKAVSKGISVIQFDKKSNGAIDYLALANEILKADGSLELEKAIQETSQQVEVQEVILTPRETHFAINAPSAREVYLVGDFNHWRINDESRLARFDEGKWEKRVSLSPGKYRYKFVVDGEWILDSQNPEKEQNPFGTFDSIMKLQ